MKRVLLWGVLLMWPGLTASAQPTARERIEAAVAATRKLEPAGQTAARADAARISPEPEWREDRAPMETLRYPRRQDVAA